MEVSLDQPPLVTDEDVWEYFVNGAFIDEENLVTPLKHSSDKSLEVLNGDISTNLSASSQVLDQVSEEYETSDEERPAYSPERKPASL